MNLLRQYVKREAPISTRETIRMRFIGELENIGA